MTHVHVHACCTCHVTCACCWCAHVRAWPIPSAMLGASQSVPSLSPMSLCAATSAEHTHRRQLLCSTCNDARAWGRARDWSRACTTARIALNTADAICTPLATATVPPTLAKSPGLCLCGCGGLPARELNGVRHERSRQYDSAHAHVCLARQPAHHARPRLCHMRLAHHPFVCPHTRWGGSRLDSRCSQPPNWQRLRCSICVWHSG